MADEVKEKVRIIVSRSIGGEYRDTAIPDGLKLIGNVLDSMAVNSLIVALEGDFGFAFDDEDLSAEAFDTVESLTELVKKKLA